MRTRARLEANRPETVGGHGDSEPVPSPGHGRVVDEPVAWLSYPAIKCVPRNPYGALRNAVDRWGPQLAASLLVDLGCLHSRSSGAPYSALHLAGIAPTQLALNRFSVPMQFLAVDEWRSRLLHDLLEIYERHHASWTIWSYKDLGVMGLVMVKP